jgi:hypothetical protein
LDVFQSHAKAENENTVKHVVDGEAEKITHSNIFYFYRIGIQKITNIFHHKR